MAKELFSIATLERKESTRESKRRKVAIIVTWIIAIAYIGHSIFLLQGFPLNIPFQQAVAARENQATLMMAVIELSIGLLAFALSVFLLRPSLWSFAFVLVLSVLEGGLSVYSQLSGLGFVRRGGSGTAYVLCLALPILTIVLIIDQKRKRR